MNKKNITAFVVEAYQVNKGVAFGEYSIKKGAISRGNLFHFANKLALANFNRDELLLVKIYDISNRKNYKFNELKQLFIGVLSYKKGNKKGNKKRNTYLKYNGNRK